MEFLQSLDGWLFHLINIQMTNPVFDLVFPAITDLHKTNLFRVAFIPLLVLLWIYLYRLRGLVMAILLAISIGVTDLFGAMIKRFWVRERPFSVETEFIQRSAAGGYSFPSNHAANMFCMAFFLSAFFPKLRWFFFTIAILISFSRIYNGVHYPFDVLGGAILGTLMGILGSKVAMQIVNWINDGFKTKKRNQRHG